MKRHLLFTVAAICWIECEAIQAQGQAGLAVSTLFEALRQGEISRVGAAIEAGMDVNSRDTDGNTLLMQAAVYTTAADLEYLLKKGADVNASNNSGHTALMRAIPDLAKIKLLVAHGATVNTSAGGATPLLIAAGIHNSEAVVRYLLEKGANPKAINEAGFDALMIAAADGSAETLKILLDGGAD